MHKFPLALGGRLLGLLSFGSLSFWLSCRPAGPTSSPPPGVPTPAPTIAYERVELPQATLHVVTIPPHPDFTVVPVVAPSPTPLASLAAEHQAIAAINGGFFDPLNGQTTSAVIRDRALLADPRQNQRLVANPDLAPYLPQILDRSEWRQYRCPEGNRAAIARRSEPAPPRCDLQHALGAGPRLLPELAAEAEGFVAIANGQVVRDALGRDRRHARSALGLAADGTLILAMASQTPEGASLPELAQFLQEQGAIAALNLDGGSSASLYYRGNTFSGQRDASGQPVNRPLVSALIVRSSP